MDNGPLPLEVCVNLAERLNGCGFVFFYIEDGVQLGDLEQVVDLLGQIQQLEFAALVADGSERADQLADPGAVDIADIAEVQQNFLVAFGKKFANEIADGHAAFAKSDTAAAIHDGNAIDLTTADFHAHCEASLPPAVGP